MTEPVGPDGAPGRAFPATSAFAGDDGSAPPLLAAAVARTDPADRLSAVVEALRTERVLIPVVARLDERAEPAEPGGIAGEKSAHAAMVSVATPDGRAALPCFSSTAALATWDAAARPVPVDGRRAALSAGSDAAGVIVFDPGSPHAVQLPRPAVAAVALGEPWVPAVADEQVQEEVRTLLTAVEGIRDTRLVAGERTEVVVVLRLEEGIEVERARAALLSAGQVLADSETVATRIDSLTLRPVRG